VKNIGPKRFGLLLAVVVLLPLLIFHPVSAAISYRASGTGENAAGATTVVVTKPTGTVQNDVMVAVIGVNQNAATVTLTAPSGWNLINANNSTTVLYSATYYKVATASEGSNYTWTINVAGTPTAKKAVGVISSYSGVNTTTPIHVNGSQANASGTTMTSPSVTTTVANTVIVAAFSTSRADTVTAGSSMTLRGQAASSGGGGATTKATSEMQDIAQSGTGASGAKTATIGTGQVSVGHTFALNPAAVVSQVGYKFFSNSTTSGSVGSALAAQDTLATAPAIGTPFRLRMLLGVADAQLATSTAFKLQYKSIDSGSCSSTGIFADVGTTTPIRWYDNGSTADGYTPLNSSGSDPTFGSVTNQSYEEANSFTVSTAISAGNSGMWDFALTLGSNADTTATYCLRAVTGAGVTLTTYSQTPAIQPLVSNGALGGQSYRWYANADSTTPGTGLATIDTAATIGSTGGSMRLRAGVNGLGHIKQISSGVNHTCAIASDNLAYCWGRDASGQLGNGATSGTQVSPVAVDTSGVLSGKTILSISSGASHTCAIASDNLAYCWGDDSNGQLGNGATSGTQVSPVAVDTSGVLSGKTILSISASYSHTCAIASDNLAYCWGSDTNGQLGNGATSGTQVSPVAVDISGLFSGKTIYSITTAENHTCAIASDSLSYCWGSDTNGQLGNGATSGNQVSPVAVDTSGVLSSKTILSISAGRLNTCVIASDNLAYCWGFDVDGQLGNGATSGTQISPVAVDTSGVLSGKTILSISVGSSHTCAIASDNLAYCWGDDFIYQLGNGFTSSDQVSPVAVTTSGVLLGKTILNISAANGHTCAIASDNQSYCWGEDFDGQLGNGATSGDQVSPVAVDIGSALTGKTISSVSAGATHTCAVASDNLAYCWGSDTYGELGNGATAGAQVIPVAVVTSGVLSGKTILSISSGGVHTCAIASDNLAYCWGNDTFSQLGNGATSGDQVSPLAVDTSGVLSGKTILSISAGYSHTCAIASDNLAYCWGSDTYGQLGNGATSSNQASPVAVDTSGVLSGKTIVSIKSGADHTCAIASDNLAYCWGDDGDGQLGNGATSSTQVSPVAVDTSGVLSGKTISRISAMGDAGAGTSHTCVIASDNLAYCWGSDANGQLGNGATSGNQVSPVAVDTSGVLSGKTIQRLDVSNTHTCAIASDNLAYCWGNDTYGQLGNGATSGDQVSPVAVDTSGVLSGRTVLSVTTASLSGHTCVIASGSQAYCWGDDSSGQLGNGSTSGTQVSPVAVTSKLLSPVSLTANKTSFKLQFAQKSAGSCSAQTGFADVTGSTLIAFNNNATPANGASITTSANDPTGTAISVAQTYHEAVGTVTNPNAIAIDKIGLWDFSLIDNSAPATTSYCLRLAGADGSALGSYVAFPEITTATPPGPTLDQMTRGGGSVLNGIKQNFSW
jgi:alpha-tubulin suppressor-like RCC1 family protein